MSYVNKKNKKNLFFLLTVFLLLPFSYKVILYGVESVEQYGSEEQYKNYFSSNKSIHFEHQTVFLDTIPSFLGKTGPIEEIKEQFINICKEFIGLNWNEIVYSKNHSTFDRKTQSMIENMNVFLKAEKDNHIDNGAVFDNKRKLLYFEPIQKHSPKCNQTVAGKISMNKLNISTCLRVYLTFLVMHKKRLKFFDQSATLSYKNLSRSLICLTNIRGEFTIFLLFAVLLNEDISNHEQLTDIFEAQIDKLLLYKEKDGIIIDEESMRIKRNKEYRIIIYEYIKYIIDIIDKLEKVEIIAFDVKKKLKEQKNVIICFVEAFEKSFNKIQNPQDLCEEDYSAKTFYENFKKFQEQDK